MYSRYPNYQPFDPLQNRLSQSIEAPPATVRQDFEEIREQASHETALPAPNPDGIGLPELAAAGSALSGLLGGGNGLGGLGALSGLLGGGKGSGGLGALSGLLGGSKGSGGLGSLLGRGGKGLGGLLEGGIGGLLKNFSLNWDSGDILLALILLFMSMESDDEEIIILLGLMLFMGL